MRKLFFLTCALFLFVGAQAQLTGLKTVFNSDKLVGHWEFKTAETATTATKGNNLAIVNSTLTYWQEVDGIGTMRLDGGGSQSSGLELVHGLEAAEGETKVAKYALMFDIKIDANKGGGNNLSALYYTGQKTDACVFVAFSDNSNAARVNGIGCGQYKKDALLPGEWNRILVNVDLADKKKIEISVVHPDGTVVFHDGITDLNANIITTNLLYLLGEGNNDTEYGRLNVSQIAFFDDYLTEEEVKGLTTCTVPKVSTDDNGPWYYIQVKGDGESRENRVLTAETDSHENDRVNGRPIDLDNTDNQLWRFEKDGDNYVIISKGYNLKMDLKEGVLTGTNSESMTAAVLTETPSQAWAITFGADEKYAVIQTGSTSGTSLHLTSDYNKRDYPIIGYGTSSTSTDANTLYRFVEFNKPFIITNPPVTSIAFGDIELTKKSIKTIAVEGLSTTGDITYVKSGEDADIFTIDATAWTAAGGKLEITAIPTEEKDYTASIVFSSAGAEDVTVTLTATGQTPPALPVNISDETTDYWYYIYFNRGSAYMQGYGLEKAAASSYAKEIDAQLWKFVSTEFSKQYKIINKAGGELTYTASASGDIKADRMYLTENSTYTFDFVQTGTFWQLKCNELRNGSGSFINKTNNDREYTQYYVSGDDGNKITFTAQDDMTDFPILPSFSTATEEFWYYIQFVRNNDATNGLVVQSYGLGENMKAGDKTEYESSQYWKLTGNDENFILTNYDGLNVKLNNGSFQTVDADGDAFELVKVTGGFSIKRKATTTNNGFNPSGGSYIGKNIGEYGVNDAGSALDFVAAPAIPLSSDATLKSLSLSEGSLNPAFDPETTAYTATVTSKASVTITAEATHKNATVTGDGEKTLTQGGNMLIVSVTAEDGTKKNYMISVTYLGSGINGPDASLKINAINGILTVTFDGTKDVKVYTTTGILVDNVQAEASYVKALNNGIYVLVIDGISYKVFVK